MNEPVAMQRVFPPSAVTAAASTAAEVLPLHTVPTVGALLVDMNRLSAAQAEEVLILQRQRNERFGRTAVALGYITENDLQVALARQQGLHVLFPHDRQALAPSVRRLLEDSATYSALQHARSQIQLRWLDESQERRTLAVVSPNPADGRSHFTAVMGLLFAQQGMRVLVVDADHRKGELPLLFGVKSHDDLYGLQDAMRDPAILSKLTCPLDAVDLRVLSFGSSEFGTEGLYSQAFSRLLDHASSTFDIVLIDTPPARENIEAITIATRASGAVSVVRFNKTPLRDQAALLQNLREAGVDHVGTVALKT